MRVLFVFLTIVLAGFGMSFQAQAQCTYLQPNGVVINPGVDLLEIVGGNLFGDEAVNSEGYETTHDVFVYLTDSDPNNLWVALINQSTLESTLSSFPVSPFYFGTSDKIINTDEGLGFCAVEGAGQNLQGVPTFFRSNGDLVNQDWDRFPISPNSEYDSCNVFPNVPQVPGLPVSEMIAVAHNLSTQILEIWLTANSGETWNLIDQVNNVLGPAQGGIVPAAQRSASGDSILLFSQQTGGNSQNICLYNANTDAMQVVATDDLIASLRESGAATNFRNQFNFWSFHVREIDAVINVVSNQTFGRPGGDAANVVGNTPAPDAGGSFFGTAVNHIDPSPATQGFSFGVFSPGGNSYNIRINDDLTGEIVQVPPQNDAMRNIQTGPVGISKVVTENQWGFALGYSGSYEYAQCVFGNLRNVPTLSEWGLIATAGILGLAGFIVIRRRQAAA